MKWPRTKADFLGCWRSQAQGHSRSLHWSQPAVQTWPIHDQYLVAAMTSYAKAEGIFVSKSVLLLEISWHWTVKHATWRATKWRFGVTPKRREKTCPWTCNLRVGSKMLCTFLDPTVLGETAQTSWIVQAWCTDGLVLEAWDMFYFEHWKSSERVLKELDSSPFMYAVFAAGKITSVGLKKSYIRVFSAACGRPLTLIARSMDTRFLQAFVDLITVQLDVAGSNLCLLRKVRSK